MAKQLGLVEDRIGLWSSGVDVAEFTSRINSSLRTELGLKDRFVIMCHGTIAHERGIQETFAAILEVAKSYPDVMLVLLGRDSTRGSSSVTEVLKKMEESANIKGHLLMLPEVPVCSVADYLNLADIGIVPLRPIMAYRTSSPLKLMEYLAMGKPVVLTDIEAHRDMLGNSISAFYSSSYSPKHLAEAIIRAYYKRSEFAQLGKDGRALVSGRFTWDAQAKSLEAYLKSVISGKMTESWSL